MDCIINQIRKLFNEPEKRIFVYNSERREYMQL